MTDISAVARPYANAIFELAQQSGDYTVWSQDLAFLALVAADADLQELIQNPKVSKQQVVGLLVELCKGRTHEGAISLVRLLVQNRRIAALPGIAAQYEALRAEAERKVDAQLVTAHKVDAAQLKKLTAALEKRLGRAVQLTVEHDPSLLGGALIRAGDLVIDGSARSRLQKLASAMTR